MSTYRQFKGYSVKSVSSDPANPQIGQVWYNDTTNKIKGRIFFPGTFGSGGNVNTARQTGGSAGTTPAGLLFAGYTSTNVFIQ